MKEKKMPRKRKNEEKPEEVLEVTEDFVIEDVSDVENTEELQNLEDLNVTEIEAAIEDGEKLELVEEQVVKNSIQNSAKQFKAPAFFKNKKIKPIRDKPTHDHSGIKTTHGLARF
jgi:hypothetical protein